MKRISYQLRLVHVPLVHQRSFICRNHLEDERRTSHYSFNYHHPIHFHNASAIDQKLPLEKHSDLLELALIVFGEVANLLLQGVDVLAQGVLLRPRLLVDILDLLEVLVVLEAQLVGALRLALIHLLLQLLNQPCA